MDTNPKNGPERIGDILSRMVIDGRRLVPDAPLGLCTLCGTEATHGDSIVVSQDREHYSCREKVRAHALSIIVLEQDFLHAAKTLAEEELLLRRLMERLTPYTVKPSPEGLCRMITFCLAEIAKDPSIRAAKKKYLATLLTDIRKRYLPTTN